MSEVKKDSVIKLFGKTISLPQQRQSSLQSSTCQDTKDGSMDSYEWSTEKSGGGGGEAKKIIRCPRCNSMETKFCYFNNYNVKQPRHFCKKCQRYWTCGGTMRNVAVGSGRRKSKATLDYRTIMVSNTVFSFYPSALGKHSRDDHPSTFRALLLQANPAAYSRSLHFHERA